MIICFSGTGNSLYVATQLGKHLSDEQIIRLQGDILIDPSTCQLTSTSNQIIWIFPTYSWGVPPVVERFIKEVDITNGSKCEHHMVTTCGDDIGCLDSIWRKLIANRSWRTGNAYSIIMPNTYVLMKGFDVDTTEVAKRKIDEAPRAIAEIAERIANGVCGDILVRGSWPWFKTHIIHPYFKRFCMSPKHFRSNGRCIGCGRCAKECPMSNITMKPTGQPLWHSRCALCLRCYHICPVDAVTYGKTTNGKGQYFNR